MACRLHDYWLSSGLCIECGEPRLPTSKRLCARHAKEGSTRGYRWRMAHPDKHNRYRSSWNQRNPEKVKAYRVLNHEVRKGRIIRPDTCEKCGAKGRIHGHHHDYSKPLDVRWLCNKCHTAEHFVEDGRG